MMNSNWMVKLAIHQRNVLIGMGYSSSQVMAMSLQDTTDALKSIGYNFKANSPLKNR